MKQAESMPSRQLLKRLVRDYVGKYRGKIFLAVLCMIVVALATAANAKILQPVLDEIFINKDKQMLMLIPLALIGIAIINGLANYAQTVLMRYVGQRVIADMQLDLFAHLIHSDLDRFHDQASGRFISRFTNDINMMRHSISNVLTGVVKELLTMIFLVGLMFYESWELSIIALIGFPLAIFPIVRLGKRMRRISDGTQNELGEFTAQLDESFKAARIVKAYSREAFEIQRARHSIHRLFSLYFKAIRVQSAASPMMEAVGGIAIAGVVWYGGYQVIQGDTTPGAFFTFIAAMLLVYKPIKSIASMNTYLQEGLAAAQRFFDAMDVLPHVVDAVNAVPLRVNRGHIHIDQAGFCYANSHAGLHGVTLDIPAGATVALVGASGSGKSTLMNLILRFYNLDGGDITIDGQSIQSATQQSLREQIALVSQEVVLFDDTVRANIAYGRLDASEEEIMQAARLADAHRFIEELDNGYDTMIGPHGVKLSGGQRQRLSIARAILKDAPILLLDEATSSLDSESERSVQKALDELMENRTTLVIAHRLSTVQHADLIYVMNHGKVVECGTHDALMAAKGDYYRLYNMQFSAQADRAEVAAL